MPRGQRQRSVNLVRWPAVVWPGHDRTIAEIGEGAAHERIHRARSKRGCRYHVARGGRSLARCGPAGRESRGLSRQNGSRWVRVRSPSPAARGGSQLYAVAATGTIVWAVGYAGLKTLIERWNGTAWTRVTSPSPPGADDLAGGTAISARDAWAVGQGHGHALIVHWNGRAWRQQAG
jgi:hypothetical protein